MNDVYKEPAMLRVACGAVARTVFVKRDGGQFSRLVRRLGRRAPDVERPGSGLGQWLLRRVRFVAILPALIFQWPVATAAEGKPSPPSAPFRVVLPAGDVQGRQLVHSTLAGHLSRFYGTELREASSIQAPGVYLVVGTPSSNSVLAMLAGGGVRLASEGLGEEGFQLLTHEQGGSRLVIVHGRTPRALKHGCQELVFFHLPATSSGISLEWPLNVTRAPDLAYRGSYMLPCWSAHDSLASWERSLRFNSELTLNRVWFWLDGFPIAGHPGEYVGTPLADEKNVQRLIDLCRDEALTFYTGGGWMTWHHKRAVGRDHKKAAEYYLDYFKALRGFGGFYFEPTGEPWNDGRSAESTHWHSELAALRALIGRVLEERPGFEVAITVGRYNSDGYLKRLAGFDPRRVFWWWAWGDPIADNATVRHPAVLNWYTTFAEPAASDGTHGTRTPPGLRERKLAGSVTQYCADAGWGAPWSAASRPDYLSPTLQFGGAKGPIDFDPYTMPYFYLQYAYRERCWNLALTDDELADRLHRRLFDADAPPECGRRYVELSRLVLRVYDGRKVAVAELDATRAFLQTLRRRTWTPRMQDTLARMTEALTNLARSAAVNRS